MTKIRREDIDPTVRKALGESAAHNAEARRLIAELAASRGVPVPPIPPPNNDFEEELITARHDIEELKRGLAAKPMASNPEFSLRAPGGSSVRVAGLAGWQVSVVLIFCAGLIAWAWVATHSITVAAPVTPLAAPAHS